MKKFIKISRCFLVLIISCFSLIGCKKDMTVEFVRFSIKKRQIDYCLDFTLKISNGTNQTQVIDDKTFYIEINNEEKTDKTFLYEYEETFYGPIVLQINESITLRLRVITNIKNRDYNKIILKYKNNLIINDNIYIKDNNS